METERCNISVFLFVSPLDSHFTCRYKHIKNSALVWLKILINFITTNYYNEVEYNTISYNIVE